MRLDPALHAAIERMAASELRSVNAEVEFLLREALARRGVKLSEPVARRRGRPPKEAEGPGGDRNADTEAGPETDDA